MNFKYKKTDKESIVKRHLINGESVAVIVADTGIPRSTVYNWIKTYKEKSSRPQISLRYVQNLEKKVKRLEGIIEILKKSECSVSDPLKIKLPILEEMYGQYSVYRRKYHSEKEFKATVYEYIEFYNNKRPHKKNHDRTPTKTELDFFSKQTE